MKNHWLSWWPVIGGIHPQKIGVFGQVLFIYNKFLHKRPPRITVGHESLNTIDWLMPQIFPTIHLGFLENCDVYARNVCTRKVSLRNNKRQWMPPWSLTCDLLGRRLFVLFSFYTKGRRAYNFRWRIIDLLSNSLMTSSVDFPRKNGSLDREAFCVVDLWKFFTQKAAEYQTRMN